MFNTVKTVHMRVIFVVMATILIIAPFTQYVSAETIQELQEKSENLQAQIDSNNDKIMELERKGDSLKDKIAQLNLEITQAKIEIDLTEVKIKKLSQKLIEAKEELERQKDLLKAALRALYLRRGASTVELLIASDSFSDFINGQEYLGRLQSAVKDSADEVTALKEQIEKEKIEQEGLLETQETQKAILAGKRQEQQTILDSTEGEESRYREIVASQLAELEKAEEQLAALLSAGQVVDGGAVERGQQIGLLGSTGFSTGPHTHFQVYKDGKTINPSTGGAGLVNGYLWPLLGGAGYISQSYGCVAPYWYYAQKCNGGQNSFHTGLDIAANAFTPVVASASGRLQLPGCSGGLGYVVVVDHGGGWQTWYPHMVSPSAAEGNYWSCVD